MLRATAPALTATPASYKVFLPTFKANRGRKAFKKPKAGDTTPQFDKGPVEWMPRPVKLSYQHIDELRDWMMRETIDGRNDHFHKVKELQREWSQHPLRPVLGDVEPKLPKGLFKKNHVAKSRFLLRWHKANHPLHWMWMPRPSTGALTPLHYDSPAKYADNWKELKTLSAGAGGASGALPWMSGANKQ